MSMVGSYSDMGEFTFYIPKEMDFTEVWNDWEGSTVKLNEEESVEWAGKERIKVSTPMSNRIIITPPRHSTESSIIHTPLINHSSTWKFNTPRRVPRPNVVNLTPVSGEVDDNWLNSQASIINSKESASSGDVVMLPENNYDKEEEEDDGDEAGREEEEEGVGDLTVSTIVPLTPLPTIFPPLDENDYYNGNPFFTKFTKGQQPNKYDNGSQATVERQTEAKSYDNESHSEFFTNPPSHTTSTCSSSTNLNAPSSNLQRSANKVKICIDSLLNHLPLSPTRRWPSRPKSLPLPTKETKLFLRRSLSREPSPDKTRFTLHEFKDEYKVHENKDIAEEESIREGSLEFSFVGISGGNHDESNRKGVFTGSPAAFVENPKKEEGVEEDAVIKKDIEENSITVRDHNSIDQITLPKLEKRILIHAPSPYRSPDQLINSNPELPRTISSKLIPGSSFTPSKESVSSSQDDLTTESEATPTFASRRRKQLERAERSAKGAGKRADRSDAPDPIGEDEIEHCSDKIDCIAESWKERMMDGESSGEDMMNMTAEEEKDEKRGILDPYETDTAELSESLENSAFSLVESPLAKRQKISNSSPQSSIDQLTTSTHKAGKGKAVKLDPVPFRIATARSATTAPTTYSNKGKKRKFEVSASPEEDQVGTGGEVKNQYDEDRYESITERAKLRNRSSTTSTSTYKPIVKEKPALKKTVSSGFIPPAPVRRGGTSITEVSKKKQRVGSGKAVNRGKKVIEEDEEDQAENDNGDDEEDTAVDDYGAGKNGAKYRVGQRVGYTEEERISLAKKWNGLDPLGNELLTRIQEAQVKEGYPSRTLNSYKWYLKNTVKEMSLQFAKKSKK